ncbi:FAD-dependent oxidoreductase [Planctomycetota bacterium]
MIADNRPSPSRSVQVNTPRDFKTMAKDIPCQEACPAKTNIPEYIRLIAEGKPDEAHRINQECNVLPSVLGRICTRPCEDACRHQWTNTRGPVRICHLKRSAAEEKPQPSSPLPEYFKTTGKRVAIVGGGPAGLAAGRELRRYGHEVVLFEREQVLGGQARTGVPEFRLPVSAIEEDIQAIVDQGIETRLGQTIDARQLDAMTQEYEAVLLATGANRPRQIHLEGLVDGAAIEGLNFMRCYNLSEPLEVAGDVVIIGGGFTAVDCARSARRLGGPDAKVTIMYRRSEAQMAANEEELHELRHEGINIETLVSPVAVTLKNGRVTSISFTRNVLGIPDPDGRPSFHAVPDSEFTRPCSTLIYATGQTPDTDVLPEGVLLNDNHITSNTRLFVAGDFATGNGDVIHAVADGKSAADAVDAFLMGQSRREKVVEIASIVDHEFVGRTRDDDLLDPPAMPVLPLAQRDRTAEVELGFPADLADTHAWRCYLCNHKFEINQDKCIHCDWCIKAAPRNCILRLSHLEVDGDGSAVAWTEVDAASPEMATYIWINSDECIRCGKCLRACPVGAITFRKADIAHHSCHGCGT